MRRCRFKLDQVINRVRQPEYGAYHEWYINPFSSTESFILPPEFNEIIPGKVANFGEYYGQHIFDSEYPPVTNHIDGSVIRHLSGNWLYD